MVINQYRSEPSRFRVKPRSNPEEIAGDEEAGEARGPTPLAEGQVCYYKCMFISGERTGIYRNGKRRKRHDDWSDISRDAGCPDVSCSCLTCSLPFCLEDLTPNTRISVRAKWRQQQRSPG
jgi:hypothetical protein